MRILQKNFQLPVWPTTAGATIARVAVAAAGGAAASHQATSDAKNGKHK